MAAFEQTITNSLNVFGASPPNLWGVMLWGQDWGVSGEIAKSIEKGIFENITSIDTIGKIADITPISDSIGFTVGLDIFKSIGIWDYNFTRPTIDGSDAVYDESSKITDPSTDWNRLSDPSTDWSAV